jgi:hypothetical protein
VTEAAKFNRDKFWIMHWLTRTLDEVRAAPTPFERDSAIAVGIAALASAFTRESDADSFLIGAATALGFADEDGAGKMIAAIKPIPFGSEAGS